jgi:glycosyltransferase involved in cell wall biosynthesis
MSILIKKIKPDYLWCFDPDDFSLVKAIKNKSTTIYDCVDYFSTLSTERNREILSNEKKLIKTVDYFFVNSETLNKKKSKIRKPISVVPQGFDLNSFSTDEPLTNQEKRDIELTSMIFEKIPKPIVGYVGNLNYRLNFKLLHTLINNMENVSFVFTNAFLSFPSDDIYVQTRSFLRQIRKSENTYFIPKNRNRRVIKAILKHFNVGIIPYNTAYNFNRYCYPMKLFEYFYMGIPVISTPIEELNRFLKYVTISNNPEVWQKTIKKLQSTTWPKSYKIHQRKLAVNNSWENKVNKILKVIKNNYK